MKLVNKQGQFVEVPDEQVPAAFSSGQFGLPGGSVVPIVDRYGNVGGVRAEEAHLAFASGARIAKPEELAEAQLQEKYGGVANAAAAAGEGLARGMTVGLSDPLATGIAKAVGGEKAATKVREHLAGEKEAHKALSTTSEIVGAAAPVLASGGGAGVAEGGLEAASVAREAGSALKAGAQVVGAPARGVAEIGHAAGALTKAVLPTAESVAGKALVKGVSAGVQGATEVALFNVGNQISEDTLGNHDITGEKLLAAAGHGALLGGGLGAVLGSTGELSSHVLGRAAPKLSGVAEEQAFRALNPLRAVTRQAEKVPGGARGIGRTLLDDGLVRAGDTIEDVAERVSSAKQQAGEQVGQVIDKLDVASKVEVPERVEPSEPSFKKPVPKGEFERTATDVKADFENQGPAPLAREPIRIPPPEKPEILDPMEEKAAVRRPAFTDGVPAPANDFVPSPGVLEEGRPFLDTEAGPGPVNDTLPSPIKFEKNAARAATAYESHIKWIKAENLKKLEDYADALVEHEKAVGAEALAKEAKGGLDPVQIVKRIKREVINPLKRLPGYGSEQAELERYTADFLEKTSSEQLSFRRLHEIRAALDDKLKWASNPIQPSPMLEQYRAMRGIVEDELEKAVDKAGKRLGKGFLEEYQAAKLKYQQLAVADRAASDAVSRNLANRAISPSDYASGLAGLIAGSTTGHAVSGGLHGLALGAIHHVIRERGNATAAVLLDKLSALGGIQRAVRQVDQKLERGVAGILSPGERAPLRPRLHSFSHKNDETEKGYHERVEAVHKAVSNPDKHLSAIAASTAGIAPHAPQTSDAFERAALRASLFLANKIPQSHATPASPFTPQIKQPAVSDVDRAKFMRYFDAVHDPTSVLNDMARGRLTSEQVEAVKTVYPELYAEMRQRIADELASAKKPPPYEVRLQLSKLFGIPDPSTTSRFVQNRQGTFQKPQAQNKQPPARPIQQLSQAAGLVGEASHDSR